MRALFSRDFCYFAGSKGLGNTELVSDLIIPTTVHTSPVLSTNLGLLDSTDSKASDAERNFVERETGIEPATTGLGSRCSTIELLPLV